MTTALDPEATDTPVLKGPARRIVAALGILLTAGSVAWGADLFRSVGVLIVAQQFVAGMLAISLLLAFVALPLRRGARRSSPPWYDIILGLVGFAAGAYLAVRIPDLVDLVLMRPPDGVAAGLVVIVLTIEALRRSSGWALPAIIVVFLLYGLFGDLVPGILEGRGSDIERLAAVIAIDLNGMLGLPIIVACTVVIAYLLFGALLSVTGGAQFLSDLSLALMGRFRGGSAKIAVVASSLFGTISGSAVANVVASGVVTIPWMKRAGYSPARAGGIEAVASTGGQLMPPVMGASAFLIAEFLQITYAEVLLAALVPALLYYVALFFVVDLDAGKSGIAAVPASELPRLGKVLKDGWHFLLPFVVLVMGLFRFNWQPQMAAVWAIVTLLVVAFAFGYQGKRPTFTAVRRGLVSTGMSALDIVLICAGAGIVIGVLSLSGLGFNLTLALVAVGGDSLLLLLLIAGAVCIVLGMGLPTVGVYVLLAALVAPALIEVGVKPIAAHLFVMYFGLLSFLTPPVAVAAYAAASIARAEPIATALASMRYGWTAYIVPFLFVFSPALVLQGTVAESALAATTAVAGVFLGSVAMTGYLVRPLAPFRRAVIGLSGLMALVPAGAFEGAYLTDLAGVALGAGLVAYELLFGRAQPVHQP
ncbi:TRAP transporter fused permease subunit [Maritimibacter sp. UBA3975]|uniref:TRAP transporter permease n=1 Tax=Maritimibacter sp. UBA3975 TaxID=1946833 RepID=UPI000C09F705|nr:TRAP transporter fused permease subunit [Maritimibacter sp. UBA3975]MAM63047.1 C4-dicarboxylate ABC transporter permease [Maritimibacter sp.]|tara:strand:+ start:21588 stop:23531 length:1944 start_codon:yes stop_codon:yes gene_type:complete